jgi:hypothetical protein
LTHFTVRTVCVAGCAVIPGPQFPEFFSSAIKLSCSSVLCFKILQGHGKFQFRPVAGTWERPEGKRLP